MRSVLLALLCCLPVWAQPLEKVPAAFPKVTIVGTAGPDRPYAVVAWRIEGREYKDLRQATGVALKLSGWDKANARKREKLALDWCTQVILSTEPYQTAPAAFTAAKKPFQAPQARTLPDGSVEVSAWTWRPGNQRGPSHGYLRYTWVVTAKGELQPLTEPQFWSP